MVELRDDRVTHLVMSNDISEPAQEEGAIEVTYETLGDLVQRFHDHTVEIPVHRVQVIESIQRDQRHRIVATGQQSVVLSERISEMERDNTRLRGTTMPNIRSGAIMTCELVDNLIARRVAEALEARDAARNHKPLAEGFMPVARECTYQDFLKCQPLNFNGTEGVISALTWWNSHKRTIGVDAAYATKWIELMKLMTGVYSLRNEIQKMEIELWNLTVKGNDLIAYT
ncbi:hypothetical protein Tco_1439676 [Tanacetum coccineum]